MTIADQTRPYVGAFQKHMYAGNIDAGLKNLEHINKILRDHEVSEEAEACE